MRTGRVFCLSVVLVCVCGVIQAHGNEIKGRGGLVVFSGLMDFSNLRGEHASLPATGAEPPGRSSFLNDKGIYLWYFGLRGYSEMVYPLRPGLEIGAGFNLLSSNSFMNARAFYASAFLQWMVLPWVGLEGSLGYNFLEFPDNGDLLLGHVYSFPKLNLEFPLGQHVTLNLFGGLYLPIDSLLWRVYVSQGAENSFGISGLLALMHAGLSLVVSEDFFDASN